MKSKHPAPVYDTRTPQYARRLQRLQGTHWKQLLDVQRPYRWNLRRLRLGKTLDVGCGIGRNLASLDAGSVGIDHNAECVDLVRSLGLSAFLPEDLPSGTFDSLLCAHVLEHLTKRDSLDLLRRYLCYVRPGGNVVLITPQEAGFKSDATHVRFVDFYDLASLVGSLGLAQVERYSFPLPRMFGRVFPYNEFVMVCRVGP